MIKLVDLLKENSDIPGLEVVRDWVIDDYNTGFGYNPDININQLLQVLQPYKKQGRIYRVISIPKNIEDAKTYIQNKITDRYTSFSDFKGGVKYFLPYVTQDPNEKSIIISQTSDYYSLSDWYNQNYDKLDSLYQEDPDKYWWIDTNLPEVSNTGEAIAKMNDDFEVI
jgi:hypothetical protein